MPLFGSEAFPGKILRQGQQLLLGQTIHRASVGGAMDAGGDPLAPRMRQGDARSSRSVNVTPPHKLFLTWLTVRSTLPFVWGV
jgi:hypothetical protein